MSKSTRGSWIDVNDDFLKQVQQDQHDHKNSPSQTRERRESAWDHVSSRDDLPPSREGSMTSFLSSTSSLLGVEDIEWEEDTNEITTSSKIKDTPNTKDTSNTQQTTTSIANNNTINNNTIPSDSISSSSSSFSSSSTLLTAPNVALMLIDIQPAYWSQCNEVSVDFPRFPENVALLLNKFRTAQKDIVFVRANYTKKKSKWLPAFVSMHGTSKKIPDSTQQTNTNQVEWEPFATPLQNELIIEKSNWNVTSASTIVSKASNLSKTTNASNITNGNDTFNIIQHFQEKGINTVVMCGLITSACVQHSAYGLFEAGFNVIVVKDACADRGRVRHEAALQLYEGYMYRTMTCRDI